MNIARGLKTGAILGMCVSRLEKILDRDESVLRIVEFVSMETAQPALAQEIVKMGLRQGAALADFYCTFTEAANGLESVGFRITRPNQFKIEFPSRFQPMDMGSINLNGAFWLTPELRTKWGPVLAIDNFYTTKSDGDQDRPT